MRPIRAATSSSNFVSINILDELKRVPGVGDAMVFGARDYAMRIWIDPVKLGNLGLSTQDVITAVQSQNVQAAAGRIGAPPFSSDQRLQLTVTTKGRLTTKEEFENIIVRAQPDSSFVRVKDIARRAVRRQFRLRGALRGKPAAPVGIYLAPAPTPSASPTRSRSGVEQLRPRFPTASLSPTCTIPPSSSRR